MVLRLPTCPSPWRVHLPLCLPLPRRRLARQPPLGRVASDATTCSAATTSPSSASSRSLASGRGSAPQARGSSCRRQHAAPPQPCVRRRRRRVILHAHELLTCIHVMSAPGGKSESLFRQTTLLLEEARWSDVRIDSGATSEPKTSYGFIVPCRARVSWARQQSDTRAPKQECSTWHGLRTAAGGWRHRHRLGGGRG